MHGGGGGGGGVHVVVVVVVVVLALWLCLCCGCVCVVVAVVVVAVVAWWCCGHVVVVLESLVVVVVVVVVVLGHSMPWVVSLCYCSQVNIILNFEFEALKSKGYRIALNVNMLSLLSLSRCSGCGHGRCIRVVVVVVFASWLSLPLCLHRGCRGCSCQ